MGLFDNFKKGLKEGATEEKIKKIRKKAESGDIDAMIELGTLLVNGEDGVDTDYPEGYRYFLMAAEEGNSSAINNLGVCYENGWGVEPDPLKALDYYQEALDKGFGKAKKNIDRISSNPLVSLLPKAQAGDLEAITRLGRCYISGDGVEENNQEAIKWLKLAADEKHPEAQYLLGSLYEKMNIPKEGIGYLTSAAETGFADAQSKLGYCYATGTGVEKDLEMAVDLIRQAALQGNEMAMGNLPKVEKMLEKERNSQSEKAQKANKSQAPSQQAGKGGDCICQQCGTELQGEAKFCKNCGSKIELKKFCINCGEQLAASAKFCDECGTSAEDRMQSPSPASEQAAAMLESEECDTGESDINVHENTQGTSLEFCKENNMQIDPRFNGIDSDSITVFNIKVGYTQGELDALDPSVRPDYEDGFKADSHVYWKFTVVIDNEGETGCDFYLVDWTDSDNSQCLSGNEETAETIGDLIEPTTEEMFGSIIQAVCFQSVAQSVLDEPYGYDFIDNVLENIGGEIVLEDGDKISESLVNSLFVLSEEVDTTMLTVDDGKLLFKGNEFDIDKIDDDSILLKKYAAFSEDVMGYESNGEDDDEPQSAWDFSNKAQELIAEGNSDAAREYIEQGISIAEDSSDLVTLATVACSSDEDAGLADKDWGRQIFEQAEGKADGFWDIKNIAEEVSRENHLDDKKWATNLFKQLENDAENADQLLDIADSVENSLEDNGWVLSLYKKSEAAEEVTSSDFRRLANSVAQLDDKDWAKSLYEKSFDIAEDSSDLLSLAEALKDDFDDRKWADNVIEAAIEKSEYVNDLLQCAQTLGWEFEDKDKARSIYKQAIEKADDVDEYREIAESMVDEDYLGDNDWAQSLADEHGFDLD